MGQIKPNAYPAPNPTLGMVRFDFISLPPGNYKLIIWNQLGGEQFRKSYVIKDRYFMDKIDLTALKEVITGMNYPMLQVINSNLNH